MAMEATSRSPTGYDIRSPSAKPPALPGGHRMMNARPTMWSMGIWPRPNRESRECSRLSPITNTVTGEHVPRRERPCVALLVQIGLDQPVPVHIDRPGPLLHHVPGQPDDPLDEVLARGRGHAQALRDPVQDRPHGASVGLWTGPGEHDDVPVGGPVEPVGQPVHQDPIPDLEGRLHGDRGDVEGLDQEGLDQQGQDERDDDEGGQPLEEAEPPPLPVGLPSALGGSRLGTFRAQSHLHSLGA